MSSIGTVNQLVAVIRAQLSARPESIPASLRNSSSKSSAHSKSDTVESLQSLVAKRVKSINPDDPQRGRKAFRIFLESILLSHFGENLINDPQFYQMVDEIQNAMETDADVRQQIDTAVNHLLSSS